MFIYKRISVSLLAIILFAFFATQSAFAKEKDIEMPVGSIGGEVHADLFTGAATTSIPIVVPAGRNGIEPKLELIYSSSNGNSWIGQGWKLETSVIERQTKKGINYSANDYRFNISGIQSDLVSTGSNTFNAKIESAFTRIIKKTASNRSQFFEATDKSGTKYFFGQTASSRIGASSISKWHLDRIEDVHGNYLTITYAKISGTAYMSRINYTGNTIASLSPTHSVQFFLENQPRPITSHKTLSAITLGKRLKTIKILANNNLVRAYKLDYVSNPVTKRSLLHHVTQYGDDATVDTRTGNITGGTAFPPVTLAWQDGVYDFNSRITQPIERGEIDSGYGWRVGDFNGDGLKDLFFWWTNGTNKLFINTGQGASYRKYDNPISTSIMSGRYRTAQVGDFSV